MERRKIIVEHASKEADALLGSLYLHSFSAVCNVMLLKARSVHSAGGLFVRERCFLMLTRSFKVLAADAVVELD
jgi:hypothetical protein